VSVELLPTMANIKHPSGLRTHLISRRSPGRLLTQCSATELMTRSKVPSEKVTNGMIKLVDASPIRGSPKVDCFADLHPEKYWKGEKNYRVVFESQRLTRFVVLDVELCSTSFSTGEDTSLNTNHTANDSNKSDGIGDGNGDGGSTWNCATNGAKELKDVSEEISPEEDRPLYAGPRSGIDKYALADVEVARESDLGTTDETFHCTTHLGNLLQTGDLVLGYDLITSVMPGYEEMVLAFNSSFVMPDIVLVKKAKGGVIGGGEEDLDSLRKDRAKSSGSKRRQRRQRKYERKAKELEETAARMGFVEEAKNEGDEKEKASQRELENDTDLADELERAEKALEANAPIKLDPALAKNDNS